jgi:ABC-type branched-subunit amino acid transport system ATPase component
LDELVSVCDRVVVLVGGQVIFEGRPRDLEEVSGVTAAAALRQMMVE